MLKLVFKIILLALLLSLSAALGNFLWGLSGSEIIYSAFYTFLGVISGAYMKDKLK
jgi:hypothetical protein